MLQKNIPHHLFSDAKIIKLEDVITQNIQTIAPNLLNFYNEQKILELLQQGEDIATFILKNREEIDSNFKKEMEEKRIYMVIVQGERILLNITV